MMSFTLALLLPALQADPDPASTLTVMGVDLLSPATRVNLLRGVLLLALGLPLVYGTGRWIRTRITRLASPQRGMVASKAFFYTGSTVLFVTVFNQFGFALAPLLGAAGILGIAIGFASQTSVSNIISGLFLIAEEPFKVDDVIQIGDTVGRVLSIDTLSVKLRTFDNRFVRIPNENIIKNQVTTITRFPIRRVDLDIGVAYKEDLASVRKALLEIAHANPQSLVEPEPAVNVVDFGDSSVNLRLMSWATKENWLKLKNSLQEQIKARFDADGIEIPFPHRTLYTGSATTPFPVRTLVGEGAVNGRGSGEPDDREDADGAGGADGEGHPVGMEDGEGSVEGEAADSGRGKAAIDPR